MKNFVFCVVVILVILYFVATPDQRVQINIQLRALWDIIDQVVRAL